MYPIYVKNISNKIRPSDFLIIFSFLKVRKNNKAVRVNIRKKWTESIFSGRFVGLIAAANPTTANILNMFEPIIFPIAKFSSFFLTARKVVNNSGAEVPIETIVIPIATSFIPNLCDIPNAPLTKISDPM